MLIGGAAVAALAPAAIAGDLRGTYFALEGGASWVESENLLLAVFPTAGGTTTTTFRSNFDTGWAVLGSVGYAFANNLRAELEVGYRANDIDGLLTSGGPATPPTGDLGEFTLMVNVLYDLHVTKRVSLSAGVGVGVDRAQLEVPAFGLDDDDWVFAYQGILGLNYAIAERMQVFLNYRYLHADAPDYSNFVTVPAAATQRVNFLGDLDKHAVTLGVRFALEGERAAPPAPPPAPPPPQPPARTVPKQFIVFFGFDRFDLTPEAARVVGDAVDAAKRSGAAALSIVGHTDSSGSPRYNQALSERRANAIRAELLRLGVPAAAVTASGHGEDELIVKTDDGVKEPQNRRATIDLE
jgi:outer membrane protein OmpA-like peptidoglycan-associated protein